MQIGNPRVKTKYAQSIVTHPVTTKRSSFTNPLAGFWRRSATTDWLSLLLWGGIVAALFYQLGAAALFEPDEGRNAEKAREILVLNDWVTPHENFHPVLDKPIFFYWIIAIAYKLFRCIRMGRAISIGIGRARMRRTCLSFR